jgi:hypothetical protein
MEQGGPAKCYHPNHMNVMRKAMQIYTEYLDQHLTPPEMQGERRKWLRRISEIRGGRDILAYSSDMCPKGFKSKAPVSIDYDDLLAIKDQLAGLKGKLIDVILETPGGSGEVVEDIARILHEKYEDVAFIIPGWAKSAGTILTMAGNEILMEPSSALGPIDAQMNHNGKIFSAHAFIQRFEKIKEEVAHTGILNKAYVPMLQAISPGELQSAENALNFAQQLVRDWLVQYKFEKWIIHSNNGQPVTLEEKRSQAKRIAENLCAHDKWLVHGRSIKINDLRAAGLKITDYSENPDLAEAIRRYHILIQMGWDSIYYKIIETQNSQIIRCWTPPMMQMPTPAHHSQNGDLTKSNIAVLCPKCNNNINLQANFVENIPLGTDFLKFPAENKLKCPKCGLEIDISILRKQIESTNKKAIVN